MDPRRARRALWALLVLDLVIQACGLARAWEASPFPAHPQGDAQAYWEHAGRLAAGQWVDETPFLSAPLYPWMLGLLRALGLGIPAVLGVQLLLRTLTALLLAGAARSLAGAARGLAGGRDGAVVGLLAAGLFLLLREPAFHATRLLAPTLQLLLATALLHALLRLPRDAGARRLLGPALLLGLNLLANPPMLLAVPVLALWIARRGSGARRAALFAAGALLCVLPATIHNALATARHAPGHAEFLPLSAQAGVTFAHGNAAGATGVYQPIPGVPANRLKQNQAAYAMAAEAEGEEGWGQTSRHFLRRGLEWMAAHPGDAALLVLRKAAWLLFADDYGDLYHVGLEFADPAWPRPLLWPAGALRLPWLLPLALAGLLLLRRRDRDQAWPWLLMLAVPVAVVLVFWYSPRYRLPLAPAAAGLAALALLAAWRSIQPRRAALLLAPALLPLPVFLALLGGWATGVDDPAAQRPIYDFQVGRAWMRAERWEDAVPRLEAAVEGGLRLPEVHAAAAEARVQRGNAALAAERTAEAYADYHAALPHYAAAAAAEPPDLDVLESQAAVLAFLGLAQEAEAALRRALDEAVRRGDLVRAERLRTRLR